MQALGNSATKVFPINPGDTLAFQGNHGSKRFKSSKEKT